MSTFEIKMPKLGESITEGTIASWSVKVGDIVQEDNVLFEVNTAKVSAEIPAPVAGKVIRILFQQGDTVPVGTVVAVLDTDTEGGVADVPDTKEESAVPVSNVPDTKEESAVPASNPESVPQGQAVGSQPEQTQITQGEGEKWYSPIVLQMAQEAHLPNEELAGIKGSGYLGRLSKKDISDYIAQKKKGGSVSVPESVAATQQAVADQSVNVLQSVDNKDEVREMDRVRRIIADHMVMSKRVSPHVTNVLEADVTNLVRWREHNKEAFLGREGIKLTYMPVITEAVAKALVEFPMVNSSVDGYNIILKKHIHVGIAVSLPDGNLIVPVVHDADRLNLSGLARAIDLLAVKARDNKLVAEDIEGGTFTITNFGSFKSLFGTPIINQPQAAILGVGYIEKKPAVVETPDGDMIAIRHKLYLSLSFDHRVVDGSLGGKFLRRVADYLENWK